MKPSHVQATRGAIGNTAMVWHCGFAQASGQKKSVFIAQWARTLKETFNK